MKKAINLLAGVFALAAAQAPALPTPSLSEKLDAMIAKHDFNGLRSTLQKPKSKEELDAGMQWLDHKITKDEGSTLIAVLYSRDHWDLLHYDDAPQMQAIDRQRAAIMALYAVELMVIEGERCEDRSAPGSHAAEIFSDTSDMLAWLAQQPKAAQATMIKYAIWFERGTAEDRPDDYYLCSGGTVDRRPAFLPESKYKSAQAADRAAMPGRLQQILDRNEPAEKAPK